MTVYHVRTPAGVAKYHEPIGAVIFAKSSKMKDVLDTVAHPNDGAVLTHNKPGGGTATYTYSAKTGKWHNTSGTGMTPDKMPALLDKFSAAHPDTRYTVKQGPRLPKGKAKEAPPDMNPDLKAAADALAPKSPKTYSKVMGELGAAPAGSMLVTSDGSGTYTKHADGTWHADWGQVSPEILADNIVSGSIKEAPAGPAAPTDDYHSPSDFTMHGIGSTFQTTINGGPGPVWKKTAENTWQHQSVPSVTQTDYGMGVEYGHFGPPAPPAPAFDPSNIKTGDRFHDNVPATLDKMPVGSKIEWHNIKMPVGGPGTFYTKQADGDWLAGGGGPSYPSTEYPSTDFDPNVGSTLVMEVIVHQVGPAKTKQQMLDNPEPGDTMHTDTGYEWKFDGKVWQSSVNTSMSAANFKDGAEHSDLMHAGPLDPGAAPSHVAATPEPTHKLAPPEVPYDVEEQTPLRELKSPGDDKFPTLPNPESYEGIGKDEGDQLATTPLGKDTWAVVDYTGNAASDINPGLRGGDSPDSYRQCALIDDAMRGLKQNVTLYRSIPPEAFHYDSFSALLNDKKKLIGSVFNDRGYSSTSYRPEGPESAPLVMKIHAPKGLPAVDAETVSSYHSEHEILLGRGMNYKITNVRKIRDRYGDPKTIIDVDAIGSPEYPNLKQPKDAPKATHTLSTEKKPGEGVHQALTPKGVPKIEKLKGAAPGTKLTDMLHTWTKTDHGSWVGPSGNEMDSAGVAQAAGQVAHDQGTVFHLEEPEAAHASEGKYGPGKHPYHPKAKDTVKLKTGTSIAQAAGIPPSHVNLGLIKALKGKQSLPLQPPVKQTPGQVKGFQKTVLDLAPKGSIVFDPAAPGLVYVAKGDGTWQQAMADSSGVHVMGAMPALNASTVVTCINGPQWRYYKA